MKKFLLILGLILPMIGLVACDNDNDLPNVKFDVSITDATNVNGTIYVVQDGSIIVDGIAVRNLESDKGAGIGSASYFWDGLFIGSNIQPPYGMEIEIGESVPVGKHELMIKCPVFAVDKSIATAWLVYPVQVVQSEDDIPEGGVTTFVASPSVKDTAD